jgi:hypothetical protein
VGRCQRTKRKDCVVRAGEEWRSLTSHDLSASILRVADEDLTAWSARVTMPPNTLDHEQE